MACCTHRHHISIAQLPETVDGCEDCLAAGLQWLRLRICLDCGHVACCDNSPRRLYSYTVPEPEGLREPPLVGGEWTDTGNGSLAILPYEAVRTAADPRRTLLAFLKSAYEAGARTAGWDTSSFESAWCPTPGQLDELRSSAAATFGRPAAHSAETDPIRRGS